MPFDPPFIRLPLRGFAEAAVESAVEFYLQGVVLGETEAEDAEQRGALAQAYAEGERKVLHVMLPDADIVCDALVYLLNSEDDVVEQERAKSPAKRDPERMNAARRARDGLTRVCERLQTWAQEQQRGKKHE